MLSIGHERVTQRGFIRIWIVAPVIYAMVVPIALLDVCATIYQHICFWAYGIPRVERKKYVRLLWRGAGMVKWLDSFHCMYCSYANGTIAYVRAVLIETEKYWCPIKYKARKDFIPPHPQGSYADPGDIKELRKIVRDR